MLTVLNINSDKPMGVKNRIRGIMKKSEVTAEVKSSGGVKVMYLYSDRRSGKIDWEKLGEYSGTAKGYVLCPKSVLLPKELGFKRFYSKSLYRLMVINGAVAVLSLLKNECRKITLCFCDEYGEYSKYAPLFLPLCGNMKILTKSDAYRDFADYAMGEYGACVELCSSTGRLSGCNVFVAPRFANLENSVCFGGFMFTFGGECVHPHIKTINNYSWRLPPKYRPLKPLWSSSEYFSQALYSVERCVQTAHVSPHTFFVGGKAMSAFALAANIISTIDSALDTARSKVYNNL